MSKVRLVTGSASGLGHSIADAVLASGDRLVATVRDPRRLEDLVAKYRDQVRTASLDVVDEHAAHVAVQLAVKAFGRLDVVVNNAGYGDVAPFEQLSSERFKALVGHQLLRRGQRDACGATDHAPATERLYPSGLVRRCSLGPSRQHRVPCRQVGRTLAP